MIAILAVAATIVVAPFHIATANPQWAAVFDERTVKELPGHAVRYEVIAVFADGRPYKAKTFHISRTPEVIDCRNLRYKDGQTRYETLEGAPVVTDPKPGAWLPIKPNTAIAQIRDFVCDHKAEGSIADGLPSLREAEASYFKIIGKPDEMGLK